MTSNQAWEDYNSLANKLREAISTKIKKILPQTCMNYYFSGCSKHMPEKGIPLFFSKNVVIGFTNCDNVPELLVVKPFYFLEEDIEELELTNFLLCIEDLINILEKIENIN